MSFLGGNQQTGSSAINPATITPTIKIWLDSETGVTGTNNGPVTQVINQANTSSGGTYPSGVAYRGTNQAGAEFGSTWTGWNGQTFYIFPTTTAWANELTYLASIGINYIRIPFAWERMQHDLYSALDPTYQASYVAMVNQATTAGFRICVDCHNYARYATGAWSGGVQVNTYTQHLINDGTLTFDHLCDLWIKVATLFATYPSNLIEYDIMNEPHDLAMSTNTWYAGMQTVINAIRTIDTTHTIGVPNTQGSDIYHFTIYSPGPGVVLDSTAALTLTDTSNNLQFIGHAYQENANEWTTGLTNYINWANSNNRKIILNEVGIVKTSGSGASLVSTFMTTCNACANMVGVAEWGIDPYGITDNTTYTTPTVIEGWYAPFYTSGIVSATDNFTAVSPHHPVWSTYAVTGATYGFKYGSKHGIYYEVGGGDYMTAQTPFVLASGASYWMVIKYVAARTTITTTGNAPMTLIGDTNVNALGQVGFTAGSIRYTNRPNSGAGWTNYTSATTTLNDGAIHTVCVTHGPSNTIKFYIDGVLTDTFSSVTYVTNNVSIWGAGLSSTDSFLGETAELMVFNGELIDTTVRSLHTRASNLWF